MTTTTLVLPPPVQTKFSAKILATPQARLVHAICATPYEMEANSGDILRMRRYSRLNTAPVPLGPAMNNPPVQQQNVVDIDARIDWYATYSVITKQVTLIDQDPVLNEHSKRLGQSLRETEDELIRDMLAGTAGLLNCVNGVNGDNPTEITRADVDDAVATLQNNDADFIGDVIQGEDRFGTGPVRDSYFAMCDARMIGQLEACNGFLNKAQYPNQTNISPSEWGSIGNTRYFLSSRGSVTVAASLLGNDIYNIFITGQDAYAKIEQNGASAKFIYHGPGHGDDPCELRQTCGWRMAQVPRITNDAWIINLRATLG
ncbi:MAG: N4-gp56 family major capsid protein [Candidatus Heimdallarchaeaceae archaeon]